MKPMVWFGRWSALVNKAASTTLAGSVISTIGIETSPSVVQSRKLAVRSFLRRAASWPGARSFASGEAPCGPGVVVGVAFNSVGNE